MALAKTPMRPAKNGKAIRIGAFLNETYLQREST